MTRTFVKALAPVLLLTSLTLGGCNQVGNLRERVRALPFGGGSNNSEPQQGFDASNPDGSGTVLISADAKSQISLPEGWTNDRVLHPEAEIQASNPEDELYVIVLSEPKEKVKPGEDLEGHSEIYRGLFEENLLFVQPSEKVADMTEIRGNPAIQYEITGVADNTSVMYVHTTIETKNQYYQILGWARSSRYGEQKEALQAVIESFQEVTQQQDVNEEEQA